MLEWAHTQPMKLPVPADLANDNGKPEDHLAVVVVALHDAVKGLTRPLSCLKHLRRENPHGGLHGDLVWEAGHL